MKELSAHIKPAITNIRQMEVPKQQVFIGSLKLHNGQQVYEMNIKTGIVALAQFDQAVINMGEFGNYVSKKIIVKENCMYAAAINENAAAKKIIKSFKAKK